MDLLIETTFAASQQSKIGRSQLTILLILYIVEFSQSFN